MKVAFAKEALEDLREIASWIARDNPRRAVTFLAELRTSCRGLARHPRRFQRLERYPTREIRRRVYGAYLIFYEVARPEIRITRILHGARDYEPLFGDEAPK